MNKIMILLIICWACGLQAQNYFFKSDAVLVNSTKFNDKYYVLGFTNSVLPDVDKYFVVEKYDLNYNLISKDSIYLYTKDNFYYYQNIIAKEDTIIVTGYLWNLFFFTNVADPRYFKITISENEIKYYKDTLHSSIFNTYIPKATLNTNNYSGVTFYEDSLKLVNYNDDCQIKSQKLLRKVNEGVFVETHTSVYNNGNFYIIYDREENHRHSLRLEKYDSELNLEQMKLLFDGRLNYNVSKIIGNTLYYVGNIVTPSSMEMQGNRLYKINLETLEFDSVAFGLTSFDSYWDIDIFNDRITLTGSKNVLDISSPFPEYPLITTIYDFERIFYYEIEDLKNFRAMNYDIKDSSTAVIFAGDQKNIGNYVFIEIGKTTDVNMGENIESNCIFLTNNQLTVQKHLSNLKLYNLLGQEVEYNTIRNSKETILDFSNIQNGIYFLKSTEMNIVINLNK